MMKLVRIVKGVSEIVDYDEITAKRMIEKNPDRYKTLEDFELVKDEYDKKEKRGRKSKKDEDIVIEKLEENEIDLSEYESANEE